MFCEAENISAADLRQFVSYCLKSLFMTAVCSVMQVTVCSYSSANARNNLLMDRPRSFMF